jgi:putative SOS response-associated peptidase YedK
VCGRYSLSTPLDELVECFDVGEVLLEDPRPRFNIAPSERAPVVVQGTAGRRLGDLRWGLVPAWAKDPYVASRMINARSESVATRPAFRDAFQRRRCLVPADGFYEWMSVERATGSRGRRGKIPYWIHRPDRRPFALAGIWERWWAPDGTVLASFAILTTDANERLRPLHDRMPVVIPPTEHGLWLDRDADLAEVAALLLPLPDEELEAWPVTPRVSSPGFDDPSCLEPLPAGEREDGLPSGSQGSVEEGSVVQGELEGLSGSS